MNVIRLILLLVSASAFGQSVELDGEGSNPARVLYSPGGLSNAWEHSVDVYPTDLTGSYLGQFCSTGDGVPWGIYVSDNWQNSIGLSYFEAAIVNSRFCWTQGTQWPPATVQGSIVIQENQWTNLRAVCANNVVSIYVNDVLDGTVNASCSLSNTAVIHLGAEKGDFYTDRYQPFVGNIDNFSFGTINDDFNPSTGTLVNGAVISPLDAGGGPPPVFQCSDGLDNDSDGLTDFPADPGCASVMDDDETDPPPPIDCTPPDVDPACICSAP